MQLLPSIKADIAQKLQKATERLDQLGSNIPPGAGRFAGLIRYLGELKKQFLLVVDGKKVPQSPEDAAKGSLLHQVRQLYHQRIHSILNYDLLDR
jgi:hypothetical protein